MAITTQYGNEVRLVTRAETGPMCTDEQIKAERISDGQMRIYRVSDLRAPGGANEIATAVEQLPFSKALTIELREAGK